MPPPLCPLHPDESLNRVKLNQLDCLTTEQLEATLSPGQKDCLKARPDGTLLDGHHRIYILRARGVDVDSLPREIFYKAEIE
jgi:hypothetical protein